MSMKDEFFRKIEERKEQELNDCAFWDYVYNLIGNYTQEKVANFLERRKFGLVTDQEIEVHKAYCIFENINY